MSSKIILISFFITVYKMYYGMETLKTWIICRLKCFQYQVMQMGAVCKNCRQLPFFGVRSLVRQVVGPTGRRSDRSLVRQVVGPTGRWSDRSLVRQVVGPTGRWSDRSLVRQVVGPTGRWSDRSLVRQVVGPTGRWSDRSLVRQVVGPTGRWSDTWSILIPFLY